MADDPGRATLPEIGPLPPFLAPPRAIEDSFLAGGLGSLAGAVGEGWRAGCFMVAFLLVCGLLGTGWYVALHAVMTQFYYAPMCQQLVGPSRQFIAYQIGMPRTMARSSQSYPSRCQFADGEVEIRDTVHPEFRAREESVQNRGRLLTG